MEQNRRYTMDYLKKKKKENHNKKVQTALIAHRIQSFRWGRCAWGGGGEGAASRILIGYRSEK